MAREIGQRVRVENRRPPRQAGMAEGVQHKRRDLGRVASFGVLFFRLDWPDVPTCGRSRKHPLRFIAASPLQNFLRPLGQRNLASRVDRFAVGDIDRITPEVLPPVAGNTLLDVDRNRAELPSHRAAGVGLRASVAVHHVVWPGRLVAPLRSPGGRNPRFLAPPSDRRCPHLRKARALAAVLHPNPVPSVGTNSAQRISKVGLSSTTSSLAGLRSAIWIWGQWAFIASSMRAITNKWETAA